MEITNNIEVTIQVSDNNPEYCSINCNHYLNIDTDYGESIFCVLFPDELNVNGKRSKKCIEKFGI